MRRICAALLLLVTACGDNPTQPDKQAPDLGLVSDSLLTADVALTAGDDFSELIAHTLVDHEDWASRSHSTPNGALTNSSSGTVARVQRCFDVLGVELPCVPFNSTRRMILTTGTSSGSHSSGGTAPTWTGVMHGSFTDTTRRTFADTTQLTSVHTGVSVGYDTTTFNYGGTSRRITQQVLDSVRSATYQLPNSGTPIPRSGSIVRHVTARAQITGQGQTVTHDFTRRVEVIFPGDGQRSVSIRIDGTICQLNVLFRTVSGCH